MVTIESGMVQGARLLCVCEACTEPCDLQEGRARSQPIISHEVGRHVVRIDISVLLHGAIVLSYLGGEVPLPLISILRLITDLQSLRLLILSKELPSSSALCCLQPSQIEIRVFLIVAYRKCVISWHYRFFHNALHLHIRIIVSHICMVGRIMLSNELIHMVGIIHLVNGSAV